MTPVIVQQLTFDDFHKDEYRAFQLEAQNVCLSLPGILDRLKDMLMGIEQQMKAGDHLSITLTVERPEEKKADADGDVSTYIQNTINQMMSGQKIYIPRLP